MLHLEIKQEDNQPCGFKVDHHSGVDEGLLCENDDWDNIENGKNIFYSLIQEQGKWKIRTGTDDGRGGNPGESIRLLSELFSEDDNILGIVIALFNAAPGQQFLSEFSTAVSNGLTEPQLADILADHPIFTNILAGKSNTDAQVTEMMSHFSLVADGEPGSAATIAAAYFTERIESGVGYGVIATEATFYLLGNDLLGNSIPEKFKEVSEFFKDKILFAGNYSASNPSTDLATLQAVFTERTLQIGTGASEFFEGSSSGGRILPAGAGDRVNLKPSAERITVALKDVTDSQIARTNGGEEISIKKDGIDCSCLYLKGGSNPFYDIFDGFKVGPAHTDDRIDVSFLEFTGTQPGLVDVSTRVSITTDLTRVPDLFNDGVAGDRGLAFLEYSVDDVSTTYVFIDANKDGDFTAADDMFLELVGVDNLIDESFIYYTGGQVIDPAGTEFILAAASSVVEGDGLTYTVKASEAVAVDTVVEFTVVPGGSGADQGTTDTNANDFLVGSLNPTPVTIFAGQRTATFDFTAINDGLTESVESYSVNAVVDGETLTTTTNLLDGQSAPTFALTTSADNITGTSGDDVLDGFVGTATTSTITGADTVGGAGGIDTFNITNASGAGVTNTNGALVSGFEVFNLSGSTAVDTFAFDAASVAGVTEINGSLSLGALTVTNLPSGAMFTGGAGDDMFTTSTSGQTGAVNAGGGNDTLTLAAAAHIDTTAEGAIYTGFEVLSSAAAAIDMDLITGSTITAIKLGAAGSNVTNMTATQAAAVTVQGALGATTLGIKGATNLLTSDTLALTISDGDTTESEALVAGGNLTLAGVETIIMNAVDDATFTSMENITGMNNLTVTGGGDVSFTTGAHVLEPFFVIEFSELTGTSTFNAAAATSNTLFVFRGGSAVDTVTDNVFGGNVISTGAGNDVITLTDKTDSSVETFVSGGAGADAITTHMAGNIHDAMQFHYKAGDSVSDSSATGISATLTDTIANLDGSNILGATAGSSVEFDTEVSAVGVNAGTTDVVFGVTSVTNAGDFFVNISNPDGVTHIYQDTDGDQFIEAGEFAVSLIGIQNSSLFSDHFSVSGGNLMLETNYIPVVD